MRQDKILSLVALYLITALAYISLSDWLLFTISPALAEARLVSILKGYGFVLVTGAVLLITLRRIARNELNRYAALLVNHHAILLVVDPDDGRIVDASAAATRFYGWSRSELLSRRINDLNMLPAAGIQQQMQRANEGSQRVFHFRHRLAGGNIREVDVYSGPVELDGRPRLFSIIYDVTQQRHDAAAH